MSPAREVRVTIRNKLGFHARPAAQFVRLAGRFKSEVLVSRNDTEVNGKSVMGVLMLMAEQGAVLRIRAEGEDAEEAVRQLSELVERGFDEDDEGHPIAREGAVADG